jgi:hypothetical protein
MMGEDSLIQKIEDFLEKRYKIKYSLITSPHRIGTEKSRWLLYETTWPMEGSCHVGESVSGRIFVESHSSYRIDDALMYYDLPEEEENQVEEGLRDRANWKKYEPRFKDLIDILVWADKVAKQVTAKAKVKVEHILPSIPEDRTFFCASFDAKRLSDGQKIKKIETCANAVDSAYRLYNDREKRHEFTVQYGKRVRKGKT